MQCTNKGCEEKAIGAGISSQCVDHEDEAAGQYAIGQAASQLDRIEASQALTVERFWAVNEELCRLEAKLDRLIKSTAEIK